MASIITGSGDRYKGVAPDAKLLNGKVLDDNGGGEESWIIAGMEWAAANGADVINMSLGNRYPTDGTDPMSQAVNRLTVDTDAPGWPPTTDFTEPALAVDATHTEYTLDARDGVPIGFTTDEPTAATGQAAVSYLMDTEWGQTGSMRFRNTFENLYSRPSHTTAPGDFEFMMEGKLAKPDGTGQWPGFAASPYLYNLRDVTDGAVPADLTKRVLNRQLAKVVSSYAFATPGRIGIRDAMISMPLPYTLTEYYTPGTEWIPEFRETVVGNEVSPDGMYSFVFTPRSYELGRTVHERWNTGVFGPGLAYNPSPDEQSRYFARVGDEFRAALGLFGDQNADTEGGFTVEWGGSPPGSTQPVRDGEIVYESQSPGTIMPSITLPPEEATYTLRTTATTSGRLSTRVDAEWTFRSGHVAGVTPKPVPALAVRLAPNLDDHNAAPTGKRARGSVGKARVGCATSRATERDVWAAHAANGRFVPS